MDNGRTWRLDILIPGLLLAAFLCDAGCRFVRLEYLAFRADEALSQFRPASKLGHFEPNRRYHNDRATGDLAVMSNRPDYRVFREQTFTTDDEGCRDVSEPGAPPPSVLMVGSSFTAGCGNSDEETLPFRIGVISGCRTYNAGGMDLYSDSILRLARNHGMRKGLVIVECLERYVGDPILPHRGRMRWLPYRDHVIAIYRTIQDRLTTSPLQVACRRIYKSLQNDRVLPNTLKEGIPVRELRDGQRMLFLLDLEKPKRFDGIPQNIDAYVRIRDELEGAGLDLALVIVPDKLTVYRSLLREPVPQGGDSLAFLAELERSARARNLTIVNLAPVLKESASQALDHGEIIYWSDDAHWNPKGIEIAAQKICDTLDIRARCGR